LCRPAGGLNDMLCQIDNSCRYAERFGRLVIVETDSRSTSSFKDAFSNYFVSRQPRLRLTAAYYRHLFDSLDVYPRYLHGRVNSCATVYSDERQAYLDAETKKPVSFDFSRAYREPLLVHHAAGGNGNSLAALARMRLHDAIVDTLVSRFRAIEWPYTGI